MATPNGLQIYTPNERKADDPVGIEVASAAVAARARAEVEARTFVAQKNPRNVNVFRDRMLAACDRFAFADAAQYEIKRGGKEITGLSIRFAEECVRNYGNLDISVYLISETPTVRVLKATVVDLEVNVPWSADVVVPKTVERRFVKEGDDVISRRKNSNGQDTFLVAATDDEVQFKQNREQAKVVRNLILALIPSEIREECEEKIEATIDALGNATPEQFRDQVVGLFAKRGIPRDDLDKYLGKSLSTASVVEVKELRRVFNAVKSNETVWAEALAEKVAIRTMNTPKSKGSSDAAGNAGTGAVSALRRKLAEDRVVDADLATSAAVPAIREGREIPARIRDLYDAKTAGLPMTDDDDDDLRQFQIDNPSLFPSGDIPNAD